METDTDGHVYDASPFSLSVPSAPSMEVPSTEEPNMEESSAEEPGRMVLKEVPFDQHALYYNMQGKKYLHVFNHYKYESNQYYGPKAHEVLTREGTQADVKSLKSTFEGLGFKTVVHEDLRYAEILHAVTELSRMEHRGTSCVAVAILTHGRNGGVLLAHDKPYYFTELSDILQNGHPSLVGKPKVFFLQACRSGHVDRGRPVLGTNNVVLPKTADTLFFYSSSEHYYSYRHVTRGAWMMQSLCDVLNQYHQFFDLGQMLTFVQNVLQIVYFSISFLNDVAGTNATTPKNPPLIRKLKDILFSLVFPLAIYVSTAFWSLYFVHKDLIFPREIEIIIPVWMNHVMHTLITPFIFIELLVTRRNYPRRKLGISNMVAFNSIYILWLFGVYLNTGHWVYPFMNFFNWPLRFAFCVISTIASIGFYILGEKINYAVCARVEAYNANGVTSKNN